MATFTASGKTVLLDDADWEKYKHITWYLNAEGYVVGSIYIGNGLQKSVRLSRLILDPPKGIYVDHINADLLDNRRSNLRVATPSQNMMNKKRKASNSSGYKGVSERSNGCWQATIKVDGVNLYLGSFSSPELAHEKYKEKAIECFGEFACFR